MRSALLVLSILTSIYVAAQLPPPHGGSQHINTTRYKLSERRAAYPFKKATAIKLASFGPVKPKNSEDWERFELPMENDTICLSKLNQLLQLNQSQIDTLTDILYNTCYRNTINTVNAMACYFPRNAILFMDQDNHMMEYVEICFECHGNRESKEGILKEKFCDNTYRLLKKYFDRLGLNTSVRN